MRKVLAAIAAAPLVLALGVLAAPAASAETISATACQEIDYQVTIGTTVVFTYGPDCPYGGFVIDAGTPSVAYTDGTGPALVWNQAYGRVSATEQCKEGWSPSWGQWMNGGAGGFTCDKEINWGTGPGGSTTLAITVNTKGDFVVVDPDDWDQWVVGCLVDDDFYPDLRGNCAT